VSDLRNARAVPRVYGSSFCAAFAAELDADARYIMEHMHRCNGEHSEQNGLKIHSCECTAVFYFMEDALEYILGKLQERENYIEVTGFDRSIREYFVKRSPEPEPNA
jgi:hypothetical protein